MDLKEKNLHSRHRRNQIRKRRRQRRQSMMIIAFFLVVVISMAALAITPSSSREPVSAPPTPAPTPLPESQPEILIPQENIHFELPDSSVTEGTSSARIEFSHGPATGQTVHPGVRLMQETVFDQYNTVAVDLKTPESDKVLYLTFDCGYEYEGRTAACLDILKEKNIPAAFYLVGNFAEIEPALTQRMIDEGHVVGNHSAGHEDLTELSDEEVMEAISSFDEYMREHFNYTMTTFRFPSGTYSERTLALVNSFGYTTWFWSIAYRDWECDQGNGTYAAMEQLKDRLHPGGVILLHCVSADEPEVLSALIDYALAEGYTFMPIPE